MIIAIDLDDTLNNLIDVWLGAYNEAHGDCVASKDITGWDFWKYVKCGKGIYKFLTPQLFAACVPRDGAVDVTQRLSQSHELIVVSSTLRNTFDAKRDWLARHFPHIPVFIAAAQKQYIRCDVLIDDGTHNLTSVGTDRGVCFSHPHNQDWQGRRVHSWYEVENVLGL